MATTMTPVSPEIERGSLVGLKKFHTSPVTTAKLKGWTRAYGRGPFLVCAMQTRSHVSLQDMGGKLIHFGSTADPSLHISYVERWKA